jgi:hypothetical protein
LNLGVCEGLLFRLTTGCLLNVRETFVIEFYIICRYAGVFISALGRDCAEEVR